MINLLKLISLGAAILLLSQCGVTPPGAVSCTPNVIDSGLELLVQPLSPGSNVYLLTLCTNATPTTAVYSVYGGLSEAQVDNTKGMSVNGALRLADITGTTVSGASFQVTFQGSDTYFAIYQDQYNGMQYSPSNSVSMVTPHELPGR